MVYVQSCCAPPCLRVIHADEGADVAADSIPRLACKAVTRWKDPVYSLGHHQAEFSKANKADDTIERSVRGAELQ